ncbi:MAG: hypothetical protein HYY78_23105 [Betaproteobacteria bacterium]|nr:hypothetical protein [Betaproteobacteria bacterium]
MKLRFTRTTVFLTVACFIPAAAWAAQSGEASRYPARPVRVVIGFTPGGTPDITSRMIGAKLTESLNDTIAGRVQFFMSPLSGSIPLVKAGKLRALGVSCLKRVGAIPDVPTLAESALPGFRFDTWSGVLAPAKTPRAIINKLHAQITRILALPEIHQKMTALGVEPDPTTPAGFDELIAEQVAEMAKLARQAGIRPQ